MNPLTYPDRHHLNAAFGWLELGNLQEAREELAQLAPVADHPEVLSLAWHLHSATGDWHKALEAARKHVVLEPESAEAWIQQSYSLHELQLTDQAFRELKQVVDRFEDVGTIPYNLACYTCRMGQLDEARSWLKRAQKILGKKSLLEMAADDPDLEALRGYLDKLG